MKWDPSQSPPRPVPIGFFLDRLWIVAVRFLALFGVMTFLVWIRRDFDVHAFGLIDKSFLALVLVMSCLGVVQQAWFSYRLLKRGVCVEADVIDISAKMMKGEKIGDQVRLRWAVDGKPCERSRLIPVTEDWRSVSDRAWEEKKVVMLVDPVRPKWSLPLHVYVAPRPKSLKGLFLGGL